MADGMTTARTSEAERRWLLEIARTAIVEHLGNGRARPPLSGDRRAGAFVTLQRAGCLRGCIGHLPADQPLPEVIARCAIAAATSDPRFPPLTVDETIGLAIEISVLGPLEPIDDIVEITVGRHGVLVEQGWSRGLLLPQVAIRYGWDARTFVEQTCLKAGLAPDAWLRGARVLRFDAEVFREDEPISPA
jgi:AmmeMemoRadiSam system protein A